MDNSSIALLAVAATVIVGLIGLIGVLLRRNNKNNPHGMHDLSRSIHSRLDILVEKIDSNNTVLTELKTIIDERLPKKSN